MAPAVALIICAVVVAVLLRIEFTRNPAASAALWVPTCWMLIAGSRPVGRWLGAENLQAAEGSPWDRLFLTMFLCAAVFICFVRRVDWVRLLKDNSWLVLLFLYLGISILWADSPFVSLKRLIRSAGPILMAVVMLSESRPLEALSSILRRCAYVLIPLSVVLIRYYPQLGRAYHNWTGIEMWTGVTTHKNSLGQLCAVSAVFLVWELLRKGRLAGPLKASYHTYADLFVLGVAVYLLVGPGQGGFSATSLAIVGVGITTFVTLDRMPRLAGVVSRNLKIVVVILALSYWIFADFVVATVSDLFGRNRDLTGRATEIWPMVLEAAARHPLLGAGYGGVWGLGGELSAKAGVEQAHNGYLDVYLELGIVGLVFLAAFFLNFCSRIRREFGHEFDAGLFGLSFLLMTLVYNMSETAFFDVYLGATMVLVTMVFSVSADQTTSAASIQPPVPAASRRSAPVASRPPAIVAQVGR